MLDPGTLPLSDREWPQPYASFEKGGEWLVSLISPPKAGSMPHYWLLAELALTIAFYGNNMSLEQGLPLSQICAKAKYVELCTL